MESEPPEQADLADQMAPDSKVKEVREPEISEPGLIANGRPSSNGRPTSNDQNGRIVPQHAQEAAESIPGSNEARATGGTGERSRPAGERAAIRSTEWVDRGRIQQWPAARR